MRLWMLLLLLLHLHLDDAAVACVSLAAPSNVSITSFNMEHTLSFLPGPETPSSARFTAEILCLRKTSWTPVASCSELRAGQTCNVTRAFKDPFNHYRARVRASAANQTSSWTTSEWFNPLTHTVLGPPDVSVSGCGNCLLLQLSMPTTKGLQHLKDLHRELVIHVRRSRDDAQFSLTVNYKEEIVISYLQPGVEYCVTLAMKTLFNSNSVTSKPYCAFTSLPTSSLDVVYSLLGAFSAMGFLLLGLLVYGSQMSFRLRRRLPAAPVTRRTGCAGT